MQAFFDDLGSILRKVGPITWQYESSTGGGDGFLQLHHKHGRRVGIHRLWAVRPGRGSGTATLRALCELADRYNVEITLKVLPFGPKPYPMNVEAIGKWYRRHGFVGRRTMSRIPMISSDLPSEAAARRWTPPALAG